MKGKGNDFDRFVKAHPALEQWKTSIQQWAGEYGVSAINVAAIIWKESKGINAPWNPAVQGAGVAQINVNAPPGGKTFNGEPVDQAFAANPDKSIQFLAYHMAQAESQGYTDANSFYTNVWNPGFKPSAKNPLPGAYLKGYTVKVTGNTPQQKAAGAQAYTAAKAALTSTQWAVYQGGKVKFVATRDSFDPNTGIVIPNAPKGTLTEFGLPLKRDAFLQKYAAISDDFVTYTGQRPSQARVADVIKQGLSQFQLRQQLAHSPGFTNSPVWKQNAPGYADVWHQIYGPNSTPDKAAISGAIANNLSSGAFADTLRQRTDYTKSNEYQGGLAANQNVFRQIYGEPQTGDAPTIETATRNGWDSNQFAAYLRQQPQWKSSAEAQQLYYGLADRLGLIQGNQTVLGGKSG